QRGMEQVGSIIVYYGFAGSILLSTGCNRLFHCTAQLFGRDSGGQRGVRCLRRLVAVEGKDGSNASPWCHRHLCRDIDHRNVWMTFKSHTTSGATPRAGSIFPTLIFLISNKLLIYNPNSITPPVAVNSFIMDGVTIASNCPASKLMPPWYIRIIIVENITPTPSVDANAREANPSSTDFTASRL